MSTAPPSLRRPLLLGAGLSLAMSAALWLDFQHHNAFSAADGVVWFAWLLAWNLALVVLGQVVAGVLAKLAKIPVQSIDLWVIFGTVFALNAVAGTPVAYAPFRNPPTLTPLGLWALIILGGAPLWLAVPRAWARAAWAALAAGTIWFGGHDGNPEEAEIQTISTAGARELPAPVAGRPARVLLIGFDGMSWHVIKTLVEAGKMPNVAALVRDGARASLRSFQPTGSALIWNSIATGRPPQEHGITNMFKFQVPGMSQPVASASYLGTTNWWNGVNRALDAGISLGVAQRVPFQATDRKVAAAWDVAVHEGVSVGVSSWWCSWPSVSLAPGSFMVSKRDLRPGAASSAEVERVAGAAPLTPPVFAADSPILTVPGAAEIWKQGQLDVSQGLALYRNFRPGLGMVYSHFVDGLQHSYWRGAGPPALLVPGAELRSEFSREVVDGYLQIDAWVGQYLELVGDDTLVILASDHGFSFDGLEHHYAPDGVLVMWGPGVKKGQVVEASVYDIAPTLLQALDLPVSAELHGAPIAGAFEEGALPALRTVPAYDWYAPVPPFSTTTSEQERKDLEFLRSLGYIN